MKKIASRSRWTKVIRYAVTSLVVGYFVTLCFPQYLFANETTYKQFKVYSTAPFDNHIYKVLDDAEARLTKSTIYDPSVNRRMFLTGSHGMYAFLSHKAFRSFANSVPFINNIILNRSDVAEDLVFLNRPEHNKRSLSGGIAHEVTHLFIRQRVGTVRASLMPTWKNEGYCEYIAGDTTISYDEAVKLWKENPNDDSKYRYYKYQLMVKYLLETEKLSIEDVFKSDFNEKELSAKVFRTL